MFQLEGDEEGWCAVFTSPEERKDFLENYQLFDGFELHCQDVECCAVRINIDGERALGALRKVSDALKYYGNRTDVLSRNPEEELDDESHGI